MSAPILEMKEGRLHAVAPDGTATPVKLVKARPLTEPDGPLAILDDKKREIASWPKLDAIPEPSRTVARQVLSNRYLTPRITRITLLRHWAGSYWWDVETDRGPMHFALKHVHRNVLTMDDGRILLKDVLSRRYEIASLGALDGVSQAHYQRLF